MRGRILVDPDDELFGGYAAESGNLMQSIDGNGRICINGPARDDDALLGNVSLKAATNASWDQPIGPKLAVRERTWNGQE